MIAKNEIMVCFIAADRVGEGMVEFHDFLQVNSDSNDTGFYKKEANKEEESESETGVPFIDFFASGSC